MKQGVWFLITLLLLGGRSSFAEWVTVYQEDFESDQPLPAAEWSQDTFPDPDRFADNGRYFTDRGIRPPQGWRATIRFGDQGWLTAESWTRHSRTEAQTLLRIVSDPSGSGNHVLQLQSPRHTDATLIRSTHPLEGRYRIRLRVGFPNFGNGVYPNGYDGGESAKPWQPGSAVHENGFYWLAIADTLPRPHNNIWWHHHRKLVIDSDNHFPPWMRIWNGETHVLSGRHPIMLFALDGNGKTDPDTGKPFLSFSQWQWFPSGEILALDAYLPDQWYEVSIERDQNQFTIRILGRFVYGGYRDYEAVIDVGERCVWHYPRPGDPLNATCEFIDSDHRQWPDYFFFGDPHINYYEGRVYYDDIRLEKWN